MSDQVEQVALDGNGNGTVRLGAAPLLTWWTYNTVSVGISTGNVSAVTGGEARLYKGEPIPTNFVSGTRTPWLDTFPANPQQLRLTSPQYLTVRFTDCDPGAIATVTAFFDQAKA